MKFLYLHNLAHYGEKKTFQELRAHAISAFGSISQYLDCTSTGLLSGMHVCFVGFLACMILLLPLSPTTLDFPRDY